MTEIETPEITGASGVVQWFGYWPSFHDAEVIEVTIRRDGKSCLRVHTWGSSGEIDSGGHYVQDRHAVVEFEFENVTDLELTEFNHQNVLGCLEVQPSSSGWRVTLFPCFGLSGYIEATQLQVSLVPGNPKESNCPPPA